MSFKGKTFSSFLAKMSSQKVSCLWTRDFYINYLFTYSFLQGIFTSYGLNSGLLHCKQILYYQRYQGNPTYLLAVVVFFNTMKHIGINNPINRKHLLRRKFNQLQTVQYCNIHHILLEIEEERLVRQAGNFFLNYY